MGAAIGAATNYDSARIGAVDGNIIIVDAVERREVVDIYSVRRGAVGGNVVIGDIVVTGVLPGIDTYRRRAVGGNNVAEYRGIRAGLKIDSVTRRTIGVDKVISQVVEA